MNIEIWNILSKLAGFPLDQKKDAAMELALLIEKSERLRRGQKIAHEYDRLPVSLQSIVLTESEQGVLFEELLKLYSNDDMGITILFALGKGHPSTALKTLVQILLANVTMAPAHRRQALVALGNILDEPSIRMCSLLAKIEPWLQACAGSSIEDEKMLARSILERIRP